MVYGKDELLNATEEAKKEPFNYYGENKLRQEEILSKEIPPERLVILRLPNLIFRKIEPKYKVVRLQFFEQFIENICKYQKIELSGTSATIKDFLHVNDLARVISRIEELSLVGEYNVSYGNGISFNDLVEIALSIHKDLDVKWKACVNDDSFYLNNSKLDKLIPLKLKIKDVVTNSLIDAMKES